MGKCRICGEFTKLTFEHVPPGATFNKQSIKLVDALECIKAEQTADIMPWELDRIKGSVCQRGRGGYFICEKCNNNTGSWYVPHYKRFVDALMYVIVKGNDSDYKSVRLEMLNMRPLPVIKQIMTMFCDINDKLTETDKQLREFLIEKKSNNLNTDKYRIFMYLLKEGVERTANFTSIISLEKKEVITLSEIATIPVGFILYLDLPKGYQAPGTEITDFAKYDYDCKTNILISINAYETHSWIPADFRSKQELKDTISLNRQFEKEKYTGVE